MSLIIGQVLSLRIRFNNTGSISATRHPYLIVAIDNENECVEIAQIDSLEGKEYKAAFKGNKSIFNTDPEETVIDKDSFVQLDNTIRVELCAELENYLRQADTLSEDKLNSVLTAYNIYHNKYEIDENKVVYMDKTEILSLN